MTHKSAEEVAAELKERLGQEFGGDLNDLRNAYLNTRIVWRFYRSLFGTNKERIDLLNEVSGIFFRFIEEALFEKTILGLCRLTDPIETGKGAGAKKNLTYKMLGDFLPEGEVRDEYGKLLTKTDQLAAFARDLRNRHIAHNDYLVYKGAARLETASRNDVQELLDAVGNLLQFIYQEILEADLALDVLLPLEDEMRFLQHLYEAREERRRVGLSNERAMAEKRYKDYVDGPEYPAWLQRTD